MPRICFKTNTGLSAAWDPGLEFGTEKGKLLGEKKTGEIRVKSKFN